MRWRAVTWAAVAIGVAAALALAVDAVVGGIDEAAGLAGVIVGFCEIGALLLGLAGWAAERRRAGPDSTATDHDVAAADPPAAGEGRPAPASPAPPPTADGPKFSITADRIEKSQFGDGNIQIND
jgi:hypothetical protein